MFLPLQRRVKRFTPQLYRAWRNVSTGGIRCYKYCIHATIVRARKPVRRALRRWRNNNDLISCVVLTLVQDKVEKHSGQKIVDPTDGHGQYPVVDPTVYPTKEVRIELAMERKRKKNARNLTFTNERNPLYPCKGYYNFCFFQSPILTFDRGTGISVTV